MDYLWSPWRYQYISKSGESQSDEKRCIFCEKASAARDRDNLVIFRAERNFILLNLYPYTTGHLMIAPYAHVATLTEADQPTLSEMMLLTARAENHLRAAYRAPGFNAGMNIGACAGAGVAEHIHMHVLPRWAGDANFMTTVGETRVLSEDLATTYEKLAGLFASGS
jgi:ATP adenylyltransferase